MNKKIMVGIAVAAALLAVLSLAVMETDWSNYTTYETPQKIDFSGEPQLNDDGTPVVDENGKTVLSHDTLNYVLFETYGPLLLILALLMFGAMIGGVCLAREESEHDDSD